MALKRRLMARGLEYFAKKGVDGTGMSELLAAAETSPGAFYKLFDSKEAFVRALIEETINPIGNVIDEAGKEADESIQAIALGLRITLEIARRYPDWGRFVSQTALVGFESQTGFAPRVARDVSKAKSTGEIDDADDLLLNAIALGAFLSGVAAAGYGLLNPDMISGLTERALVAMGADRERAHRAVKPEIDAYVDAAIAKGRTQGIFEVQ